MMYYYELQTMDPMGFDHYYYYTMMFPVPSEEPAEFNNSNTPQGVRLLAEDWLEIPVKIKRLTLPQYLWRKYFKRNGTFGLFHGCRIDWEKEWKKAG